MLNEQKQMREWIRERRRGKGPRWREGRRKSELSLGIRSLTQTVIMLGSSLVPR